MSQLVRLEGKHTCQNAHCAVVVKKNIKKYSKFKRQKDRCSACWFSSQRDFMMLWFQTPRKPVIGDGCDQEDTKDHQYAAKDKFQRQKVWFSTTVHHFDMYIHHSTALCR